MGDLSIILLLLIAISNSSNQILIPPKTIQLIADQNRSLIRINNAILRSGLSTHLCFLETFPREFGEIWEAFSPELNAEYKKSWFVVDPPNAKALVSMSKMYIHLQQRGVLYPKHYSDFLWTFKTYHNEVYSLFQGRLDLHHDRDIETLMKDIYARLKWGCP